MPEESAASSSRDEVLRVGQVVERPEQHPRYLVVDAVGNAVVPIVDFLRHMSVRGVQHTTERAYAHALLKWWRFLAAVDVDWRIADASVFGEFVLWAREPLRFQDGRQGASRHSRATINQNGSVVRKFYDFHIQSESGPLINPTTWAPSSTRRRRSPLLPVRRNERLFGRQRLVTRISRAIPDRDLDRVLGALRSTRDRAFVDVLLGTAARTTEILNLRAMDVDRDKGLVRVLRKGGIEWQWVPCAPAALASLDRYLQSREMKPEDPVWLCERAPFSRLSYDAIRRAFDRAQTGFDVKYTLHQLRHTAAQRMADDPQMPLPHVQRILGHRSIMTTQLYVNTTAERAIQSAAEHHQRRGEALSGQPTRPARYDDDSLKRLFGEIDE